MRLFLAIPLPAPLVAAISEVERRLRPALPGWRWVRPEGVHLTLRFLGEVPEADVDRQRQAWRAAASGVPGFRVEVGGIGVFPSERRPRVLWIGVREASPGRRLPDLAAAVETAAVGLGFPGEEHPFQPHLTLARAAPAGRPRAPAPDAVEALGAFDADRLQLYRSELGPGGARYTVIGAFDLGESAAL